MSNTANGEVSSRFEPRLKAVEALQAVLAGSGTAERVEAAAQACASVRQERVHLYYSGFAAFLKALSLMLRWSAAVRAAEAESSRFLVAARQTVKDYQAASEGQTPAHFTSLIDQCLRVRQIEEVDEFTRELLFTRLPVHIQSVSQESTTTPVVAFEREEEPPAEQTAVALVTFLMAGAPLQRPHVIRPNMLYDLVLRLSLSRWPAGVDHLSFVPLHVEPEGTLDAPRFSVRRPEDSTSVRIALSASGRFRALVSQSFPARPLQVGYSVVALAGEQIVPHAVELRGQTTIELECFDPAVNPITGFRELDLRLLDIRKLARQKGVEDLELSDFLTIAGGIGRLACTNLASNNYRGSWNESKFQRDTRDRLRLMAEIAADLEEHPAVGGGVADLSFRRIRLELKVTKQAVSPREAINRFGQQISQYVTGSDRRCGILTVLDISRKLATPPPVPEDIQVFALPAACDSTRSILVLTVVIRGNLSSPSDYSRPS